MIINTRDTMVIQFTSVSGNIKIVVALNLVGKDKTIGSPKVLLIWNDGWISSPLFQWMPNSSLKFMIMRAYILTP